MAINELELQRFLGAVKANIERHERVLRQHRDRDRKIVAILRLLLEVDKGTIKAMPTSKELLAHRAALNQLSKAERPVYELMFMYRNKEIAERLHMSVHTVKNHVKAIRRKLKIRRNRKDAHIEEVL